MSGYYGRGGGYGGGYGGSDSSVNFCEGGIGYPAYCPQPGYSSLARFCCRTEDNGFYRGECCVLPLPVGWFIVVLIASFLILALIIYAICRYWSICPLAKRRAALQRQYVQPQGVRRGTDGGMEDYGVITKEARVHQQYYPPRSQHGTPQPQYGSPQPQYGSPQPQYGPATGRRQF